MASSSPYTLRHSRRSSLLKAKNNQDISQSRTSSNDSSAPGVRGGGVVRRRSAPSARGSKHSNIQTNTTTSRISPRENHEADVSIMDNENGDANDDQADNLNLSSASAATDIIEVSTDSNSINHPTSSNSTKKGNKSSITKHELLNRYFKKINTGGYYCNLCSGTKYSNKVSLFINCT